MYFKKMQRGLAEKDLSARHGAAQGVRTFIKQGLKEGPG